MPQKSFNKNHHFEINYWLSVDTKLIPNSIMTEQILQNFTSALCTNWVVKAQKPRKQLCKQNPAIHSIVQSAAETLDGFFGSTSVRGNVKLAN